MVAAASSGQPPITTRVGSPSVCESTTSIVSGKFARRHSASRVRPPSTRRQMLRGFLSASSSGRADWGKSW